MTGNGRIMHRHLQLGKKKILKRRESGEGGTTTSKGLTVLRNVGGGLKGGGGHEWKSVATKKLTTEPLRFPSR